MISKSLEVVRPDITKYWDFYKNKDISPANVSPGSKIEVWWRCKEKGHAWEESVYFVSKRKNTCLKCKEESTSLVVKSPELAKQWHPTLNNNYRINGISMTPDNTSSGSSQEVWWKCDEGDDYQTFRLGLFGLDKLKDVDAAVDRLEVAFKQLMA